MIGLGTPVRLGGSTTWSGTCTRSPARSLYQWTRHRLRASGPCGSASPTICSWSNVDGSASWPNRGNLIPWSRNRSMLFERARSSTTRSARPNWFSNATELTSAEETDEADETSAVTRTVCQVDASSATPAGAMSSQEHQQAGREQCPADCGSHTDVDSGRADRAGALVFQ